MANRYHRSMLGVLSGLAWLISGSVATALTNPVTGFPSPGTRVISPIDQNSGVEIAQGSLCRRVVEPAGLVIRQRPTPNSPILGRVPLNQMINLVEGYRGIRGPDGRTWIQITAPAQGFISNGYPNGASNLVLCGGSVTQPPAPAPSANLCRQVEGRATTGRGLVIRSRPSELSERVGGVPVNGRLTLVSNYQLIPDVDGRDRNWVQIASPASGYVSAGNLIMCR